MKKILFCIPNLKYGGAEKVLVNLVNHMNKNLFDVTVLSLFDVGVNIKYLNKNVKYKYVFKHLFRGNIHFFKLFTPKQLYNKYIKDKYDIVVSYLEGPTARIVSGCPFKETKLVSWIHIEQLSRKNAAVAFRSIQESEKCYDKFDKTICVSEGVKDDFIKIFPNTKEPIVLYNTNESELIRKKAKEKIEEEVFNKYNGIRLCGVAKITKHKGFMMLAHIHKRLLEKGYDHKFYILGIGNDRERIEKYLIENNLTSSFFFLGYKENPYKYLAKSDIFVCASKAEGFSTAATESLIVGTPVVTTLVAGMKEMLGENNEYGIITENNEESLEQGIEKLLSDKELLNHYKKQARIRGEFFTTDSTVKAVEDMLMKL